MVEIKAFNQKWKTPKIASLTTLKIPTNTKHVENASAPSKEDRHDSITQILTPTSSTDSIHTIQSTSSFSGSPSHSTIPLNTISNKTWPSKPVFQLSTNPILESTLKINLKTSPKRVVKTSLSAEPKSQHYYNNNSSTLQKRVWVKTPKRCTNFRICWS